MLRPDEADALADWGRLVQANRDQVDRVREVPDGADFYQPVSTRFRADPRREGDASLDALAAFASRGETWLDIGAGAGRYALPLALHGVHVVAIDPSPSMLAGLREGMEEHGIDGMDILEGRWPDASAGVAGDVALAANVLYDIHPIAPFLDAMEATVADAGGSCVALLADQAPSSASDPLWPAVHGEVRAALPALPEFVVLLVARARRFEVRRVERESRAFRSFDEALVLARRQLWVEPGSPRDERLQEALKSQLVEVDGGLSLTAAPASQGIVRWWPPEGRT